MSELKTENGFANPDAAYEMLVDAHRGLNEAQSAALNARLVVILANHAGELGVLKAAIALAKKELLNKV